MIRHERGSSVELVIALERRGLVTHRKSLQLRLARGLLLNPYLYFIEVRGH